MFVLGVVGSVAAVHFDHDEAAGAAGYRRSPLVSSTSNGPRLLRRSFVLGRSVQGRPIRGMELGPARGPRMLVVGCIHGDECAGFAVARDLETDRTPRR